MTDRLDWAKVPNVTEAEALAIKALARGTATAEQQRIAWDYILNRAARVGASSFVLNEDGGDRATSFAEGRRAVGLALKVVADLPAEALKRKVDNDGRK